MSRPPPSGVLVIVSRFQPFLAGPLDLPELSDLFPHSGQTPCLLLPWRSVQEALACGDTVRPWQEVASVQSDCMPTQSTSQCHNKHPTDDQRVEKTQKQETQAQQIFSKNLLVTSTTDSMYAHVADIP